jgi:PhoPQ-activated pathogenicity-related protein
MLSLVLCFLAPPIARADETALDRYIAKPDPTYAWQVVKQIPGNPMTQYVIDLKSQTWRNDKDVNQTVWQHWLIIVKPEKVTSDTAFLYITGGRNGGDPPKSADSLVLQIAEATHSVVAELRMVPNQPLVFHHDGVGRKEDDLIAYTWDQYLKTGDDTWPARLPMTKSAVRAMDCIQEFLASEQGGKQRIAKFVVAGGSKRGWTTWCTAAVDKRVVAAVPIVIDCIHVPPSMQHHIAAYGFYAQSVGDYFQHKIMQRSHDPKLADLYAIEDPYSYRDRLTMPKFIVNASGDQFFCPDSSQFYFDDLKGEKYLRYVPNTDHSLKNSDALQSIIAFYWTVLNAKPRPKYSWTFEKDGSIRVLASAAGSPLSTRFGGRGDGGEGGMAPKLKEVVLWQANNPKARDFRVEKIGRAYTRSVLSPQSDGSYVGKIESPAQGWTAFFVEMSFDVGAPVPLKLSTAVRVLPDRLPFADLDPAQAPYELLK